MVLFYIAFYGIIEFLLLAFLKKTSNLQVSGGFLAQLFLNNSIKRNLKWFLDIFDETPYNLARQQESIMKSASKGLCTLSVVFIQLYSCTFEYKFLCIAIFILIISYICFWNLNIYKLRRDEILDIIDENY